MQLKLTCIRSDQIGLEILESVLASDKKTHRVAGGSSGGDDMALGRR